MRIMKTQILFLLLSVQVFSQSKIIGKVYYQNSGWKPVEGVLVNANGSNGDYSKTNGDFVLKFPNFVIGHTIHPSIGKNNLAFDGDGKEVELVNEKELEFVSIPENPEKALLRIIVCRKGARDIAARKYYGIIKNQVEIELDILRKDLEISKQKLDLANHLVIEKEKNLMAYQTINDSIKIYKEALRIASINRDSANERIKNYLSALDAGISIKEARKELSTEKAYNSAIKGISNIEASIKEIQLCAENYRIQLKFEEAFAQYDTITKILKSNQMNPLLLEQTFFDMGMMAQDIYMHNKAIEYFNSSLKILNLFSDYKIQKALVLNQIGLSYLNKEEYDKAEVIFINSLKYKEFINSNNKDYKIFVARTYYYLGIIKNIKQEFEKAKIYYVNAIEKLTSVMVFDPVLVGSYLSFANSRLALIYIQTKNYDEAKEILVSSGIFLYNLDEMYKDEFLAEYGEYFLALAYLLIEKKMFFEANKTFSFAFEVYEKLTFENPIKFNVNYAEVLHLSIMAQIIEIQSLGNEKFDADKKAKFLSIINKIENLLSIYKEPISKIKDLLEINQAYKFYLTANDIKTNMIGVSNNLTSAKIILYKEEEIISNKIELLDNVKERLKNYKILLEICKKVFVKYPNDEIIQNYLRLSYLYIASTSLEAGEYNLAISSAKKINELDKSGNSFGFMNLVLVNAYVLQNNMDKAWAIYKKFKNELFPNSNTTYKTNFLADIGDLEKKGVYHEEFEKIKKFLME